MNPGFKQWLNSIPGSMLALFLTGVLLIAVAQVPSSSRDPEGGNRALQPVGGETSQEEAGRRRTSSGATAEVRSQATHSSRPSRPEPSPPATPDPDPLPSGFEGQVTPTDVMCRYVVGDSGRCELVISFRNASEFYVGEVDVTFNMTPQSGVGTYESGGAYTEAGRTYRPFEEGTVEVVVSGVSPGFYRFTLCVNDFIWRQSPSGDEQYESLQSCTIATAYAGP